MTTRVNFLLHQMIFTERGKSLIYYCVSQNPHLMPLFIYLVDFWWNVYVGVCHVLLAAVPWPGIHYHAGVCVGATQPIRTHELLWPA